MQSIARKFFRLWYMFCMFFFLFSPLNFCALFIFLLWVPRFNGLSYNFPMTLNITSMLEHTLSQL